MRRGDCAPPSDSEGGGGGVDSNMGSKAVSISLRAGLLVKDSPGEAYGGTRRNSADRSRVGGVVCRVDDERNKADCGYLEVPEWGW